MRVCDRCKTRPATRGVSLTNCDNQPMGFELCSKCNRLLVCIAKGKDLVRISKHPFIIVDDKDD